MLPLLAAKVVTMKCGLRMKAKCKGLNMTWPHKTPRTEQRQNILWHKLYQCFVRSVSQGNRNKSENKQMGPNQMQDLRSIGNHKQNKKTAYGLGENICKRCNWQGLSFQNI